MTWPTKAAREIQHLDPKGDYPTPNSVDQVAAIIRSHAPDRSGGGADERGRRLREMLILIMVTATKGFADAAIIANQKMDARHVLATVQKLAEVSKEREAENERLRKALEPFSEGRIDVSHTTVVLGLDAPQVLSAARAALQPLPGPL